MDRKETLKKLSTHLDGVESYAKDLEASGVDEQLMRIVHMHIDAMRRIFDYIEHKKET